MILLDPMVFSPKKMNTSCSTDETIVHAPEALKAIDFNSERADKRNSATKKKKTITSEVKPIKLSNELKQGRGFKISKCTKSTIPKEFNFMTRSRARTPRDRKSRPEKQILALNRTITRETKKTLTVPVSPKFQTKTRTRARQRPQTAPPKSTRPRPKTKKFTPTIPRSPKWSRSRKTKQNSKKTVQKPSYDPDIWSPLKIEDRGIRGIENEPVKKNEPKRRSKLRFDDNIQSETKAFKCKRPALDDVEFRSSSDLRRESEIQQLDELFQTITPTSRNDTDTVEKKQSSALSRFFGY